MPPVEMSVEPGRPSTAPSTCRSPNGRSARRTRPCPSAVEPFDHRQRSLGRRIDLRHLRRTRRSAARSSAPRRRDRPCGGAAPEVGAAVGATAVTAGRPASAARCGAAVHEILRDVGAQPLECRIVVDGRAVARPRQLDLELRAERRARAGVQRDDAVGEQDRLVHIVGDRARPSCGPAPRSARSRPAAWRGSARRARTAARRAAGSRGLMASARATATRWRMPPDSSAGRLVRPHATGRPSRCIAATCARRVGLGRIGENRIDRQRDVAVDREPRHQRVALEDDAALGPGPVDRLAA